MNGRFFDGRRLVAEMWDGITNYASVKMKESAEEQEARLEAFAREVAAKAVATQDVGISSNASGGSTVNLVDVSVDGENGVTAME
ncbi:HIV Tat-specific factor 1, partial [Haematococcus lacustris]